MELKAAIFD